MTKNCLHRNASRLVVLFIMLILATFALFWVYTKTDNDALYSRAKWYEAEGYKTILAYNLPDWLEIEPGIELFQDLKCPVDKCRLSTRESERNSADLILFHDKYVHTHDPRPPNQIYALFNMESPPHTSYIDYPDVINWTISYRHDSTIPDPYRQWNYYDPQVTRKQLHVNYAENKTKQVAWFVSNCNDKNGRLDYAHELQKYIQVDIYGYCGSLMCPHSKQCFEILDRDYKFYLAFENSNCRDYITEKLFTNALERNILPIVMGAPPEDYAKYAPQRSYLNVEDFDSPMELANYLKTLDKDDESYNAYFQWKGTGHITHNPKKHFCEMCAMLHDNETMSTPRWIEDINDWWRGPGVCTSRYWHSNRTDWSPNSSNRIYIEPFVMATSLIATGFFVIQMRH